MESPRQWGPPEDRLYSEVHAPKNTAPAGMDGGQAQGREDTRQLLSYRQGRCWLDWEVLVEMERINGSAI